MSILTLEEKQGGVSIDKRTSTKNKEKVRKLKIPYTYLGVCYNGHHDKPHQCYKFIYHKTTKISYNTKVLNRIKLRTS